MADVDSSTPNGYVYFVLLAGIDYVKIGKSRDPHSRITSMKTAFPTEPVCLLLVEGARNERIIHRKFADIRRRGEWFLLNDEMHQFIKRLQAEKIGTLKVDGADVPVTRLPKGLIVEIKAPPKPKPEGGAWPEPEPIRLSEVEQHFRDEADRYRRATGPDRRRVIYANQSGT